MHNLSWLILWVALPFLPCRGQIKQGTWLVGGNLSGGIESRESFYRFHATVNPLVGKFINNNLCLGLALPVEYDYKDYKNLPLLVLLFSVPNNVSGLQKSRDLNFSVSPFVRKYFGRKNLLPFVQAGVFYMRNANLSRYTITSGPRKEFSNSTQLIGFGFGAGVNYFVSSRVALESVLEYGRHYQLLDLDLYINKTSNLKLRVGLVVLLSKQ